MSRTRRHRALAVAAASGVLALVGAAPAAAAAPPEPAATVEELPSPLFDPGVRSHYAFVERPAIVRRSPKSGARALGRLRLLTEDRTDELVLVLDAATDGAERQWLKVQVPIRPAGATGWVPRDALDELRAVRTLLRIDVDRRRATLVRGGRVVFRAPIGVGQAQWPTPRGLFYVRNRLSGYGLGSIYGPIAFGTSARSAVLTDWPGGGVVGIHGTNQPELIPGAVSHGCIRLRNGDIRRLARLMPVGTPIRVE